jgi:hypothetical protein
VQLSFPILFETGKCHLEHLQSRSPNRPSKRFGAHRTKKRSQACPPKLIFVRRGPIWCSAPRACPRYKGDARGMSDTPKCEARRGRTDASATHGRTLNRRLPRDGAVAGKGNHRIGNRVDRRANRRNGARTLRKSNRRSLRYLRRRSSTLSKAATYDALSPIYNRTPFIERSHLSQ